MNTSRRLGPVGALLGTCLLAACGVVQVTDSSGRSQPLGEWIDGMKKPSADGTSSAAESRQAAVTTTSLPAGVPGKSTPDWPAAKGCREMSDFPLNTDIDTGYARAMRRFSLGTWEQMQLVKQQRGVIIDPRFKHERQAGTFYHLAQGVTYPGPSGSTTHNMFMDLMLSKDGRRTTASVKYCVDPRVPTEMTVEHHAHLQRYIVDSLTRAQ